MSWSLDASIFGKNTYAIRHWALRGLTRLVQLQADAMYADENTQSLAVDTFLNPHLSFAA